MSFLNSLSSPSLAFITVLASCTFALVPYFIARSLLQSKSDDRSGDFAQSVIFRIGALHGLILALVFAQELLNYNEARRAITHETALLGNVFYDLQRYDPTTTEPYRAELLEYARTVLHQEWGSLAARGELTPEAWVSWESVYLDILNLEPATTRQESLRSIMVNQIREVSELRNVRENTSQMGVNGLFLFAAVTGLILMSIGYFSFAPTLVNVSLLTIFGIYNGLIVFFILTFSNPFGGAGHIDPIRYQHLVTEMQQALI